MFDNQGCNRRAHPAAQISTVRNSSAHSMQRPAGNGARRRAATGGLAPRSAFADAPCIIALLNTCTREVLFPRKGTMGLGPCHVSSMRPCVPHLPDIR